MARALIPVMSWPTGYGSTVTLAGGLITLTMGAER
jgi:hypothetical protein